MNDTARETIEFAGIRFWNASCDELLRRLDRSGGVLMVPAAPALCSFEHDALYIRALREADYTVADSAYFALLMVLARRRRVSRISGLQVMERFLARDESAAVPARSRRILWVVPDVDERKRMTSWLETNGFDAAHQGYYEAPFYRHDADFDDDALIEAIEAHGARWVVLCIGGGKQEKLGFRLRERLGSGSGIPILCTGAAMAFFTGGQAGIPRWADRLFLGWFFRILHDPRRFAGRYLQALRLPLVLRRLSKRQSGIAQGVL
ncbi:MAG: WecB/TagA/CpsF family glycosyltransferase [bacterium]|nr:WecB/TagA/CpsF family glycosyltransferase [bacterium]